MEVKDIDKYFSYDILRRGYDNHKKGTDQYERDQLKNSILDKYNIPWIRLKTNGSGEEEIIHNKLDEITKL